MGVPLLVMLGVDAGVPERATEGVREGVGVVDTGQFGSTDNNVTCEGSVVELSWHREQPHVELALNTSEPLSQMNPDGAVWTCPDPNSPQNTYCDVQLAAGKHRISPIKLNSSEPKSGHVEGPHRQNTPDAMGDIAYPMGAVTAFTVTHPDTEMSRICKYSVNIVYARARAHE